MIITIERYFFWLMLYSIIGWVYESFICSVSHKKFINRGFLNGPYCPIYGWGAILVILALGRIENPILLFFLGTFLTCSLEYVTSFVMELLFHARWWDYSDKRFNINGRICLEGAIVFGTFSVLLIKVIHPFIIKYTDMIPILAFHIMNAILFVLFVADITITLGGFSGFNKKLIEASALFEQVRSDLEEKLSENHSGKLTDKWSERVSERILDNEAYQRLINNINKQQRRMLKAFPSFKSINYENTLTAVRQHVASRKWKKKK